MSSDMIIKATHNVKVLEIQSYHLDMEKITFGEWLGDKLESSGLDQKDLAFACGVDQSTVSKWIGNENKPRAKTCDLIALALGLDHNEVRRRAGHAETVSSTAIANINFHTRGQGIVRPPVTTELQHQPIEISYVPIIGTAAADALRATWGYGNLFPVVRSDVQGLERPRILVVSGHCMEPTINHGDLVVVDVDADPQLGNIVVVRVGDDVTLKEFWADDGEEVILRPRNPAYEVIRIKKEDQGATLVGVVRLIYPKPIRP